MAKQNESEWKVWVDTGGTFTDCIATTPDGHRKKAKILSSSSLRGRVVTEIGSQHTYKVEQDWEAPDHFIEGFQFSLLEEAKFTAEVLRFDATGSTVTLNREIPNFDSPLSFEVTTDEEAPILAARLVTGTPYNQSLPEITMRLATTKATNALLERNGAPTVLFVSKGFKELLEIGNQQRPDLFALQVKKRKPIYRKAVEVNERLDANGSVLEQLDYSDLEQTVDRLVKEDITSAAVAFMHSYTNSDHEHEFKQWLLDKGFEHVSISSELSPFIRIIPRAETTLVNAYLSPVVQQYLDGVQSAISDRPLYVMTSAGGLTVKERFAPKDSLLSGPAGGVVGAASEGNKAGFKQIISFDMGGTSTDVARYNANFDYVFEHRIGDAHLVAPALNIETVAAGGGSICYFDGYKLCVGPESAGAYPGPACYGAGGPLTITDVNLLLGRLDPQNFHIPVDQKASVRALEKIVQEIESEKNEAVSENEVLSGFLTIANERMADAIRNISVRKGYDTKEYAMVAFGGAGGQHACSIARRLGMETLLIPKEAGLLSASGIGHAGVEEFAETQVLQPLHEIGQELDNLKKSMADKAVQKLQQAGIPKDKISIRRSLISMRLEGQETSLEVAFEESDGLKTAFKNAYKERYGHWVSDRLIEVESMRVVVAMQDLEEETELHAEDRSKPKALFEKDIWFDGQKRQSPVYRRRSLKQGNIIKGPALILDPHSTIVIEPGWHLTVNERGALEVKRSYSEDISILKTNAEVVKLELFTNRFSTIATEMGEMLQRTALSVNVKDRLDFSCALLNDKGELVVNAPHIPVHLGALGMCVRSLKEEITMNIGDVVVANHPAYGGSHLPDVTVVTPVYTDDEQLIGYAASRAHHAEIGGITPGSMPPTATNLQQEGVVIPPMHLIKGGRARWQVIKKHLKAAKYPTRNVEENIADLQAAVAANQRGVSNLKALCSKHGFEEVKRYMSALREHAESKMRETIKKIPSGDYKSEEFLDDGTSLKALMKVGEENIAIDFTGTGMVHKNNLNATPAIVNSVVMYVLRLLIDEPIPLNEGLLAPISISLPRCLLNPDFSADPTECPAVVGGNIEVSQRLVDTLLKPFERMACSQGTMNNVLFGNDRFGYYETVGGGTGAGPDFDGADAVHHHMTNTKGTDPEILEYRYPVRLDEYSIREGSGGAGKHSGGDGIYRKMTFLEPVELTVLTQHRQNRPYGLQGGEAGKAGNQYIVRTDDSHIKLNSIDGYSLEKGDQFILETPGGGGFGAENG